MKLRATLLLALLLSGCQSFADRPNTDLIDDQTSTENKVQASSFHPRNGASDTTANQTDLNRYQQAAKTNNLWQRIGLQFELPQPKNERIQKQRDWYLRHNRYLTTVSERARPYLYLIIREVEKRHIPMEVALLPIVESAFDPFAYSSGRAAGLWQMIASSGKRFGLQEDWWYNGRRDVLASTRAALDYLEYLHNFLDDDWLNAIAAYNSGEGTLQSAIRRNKKLGRPTNFWSLDLPRQTEQYVPKLLALADIIKNPQKYGVTLPTLPNQPVLNEVTLPSQFDLNLAAKMAGISEKALRKYNPAYNHWASSPKGPYTLLLPVDISKRFKQKLKTIKTSDLLRWTRYKVKAGDSLIRIAKNNRTKVKYLKSLNYLNSNLIRVGQYLLIPVVPYETAAPRIAIQGSMQSQPHSYQIHYTIKPGDSLWKIGQAFKVSYSKIAQWNNLKTGHILSPGDTLKIWQTIQSKGIIRRVWYRVRSGDSLQSIAHKFRVQIEQIRHWNQLSAERYLKPGKKLKLLVDVTRVNG